MYTSIDTDILGDARSTPKKRPVFLPTSLAGCTSRSFSFVEVESFSKSEEKQLPVCERVLTPTISI